MNTLFALTPAGLGILIVIQAGLNRRIAAHWSLPAAALLNAAVLAIAATAVFYITASQRTVDLKSFSPWFLFPGLIGLTLVLGGPWAMARFGAAHTFVLVVAAQLLTSALWDLKIEGIALTTPRVAGIVLTWVGAFVATWKWKL